MKELTNLEVKNFKENLIKFETVLIQKSKINNRVKKYSNNYYERNQFKDAKDIRYLLNEKEDEFADEDIRCLFNETNEIDYVDIKQHEINSRKVDYIDIKPYEINYIDIKQQIKSYEAKPYDVEYCEVKSDEIRSYRTDYIDINTHENKFCEINYIDIKQQIKSYEARPYEVEYCEIKSDKIKS